jgi:hypothetical protein
MSDEWNDTGLMFITLRPGKGRCKRRKASGKACRDKTGTAQADASCVVVVSKCLPRVLHDGPLR